MNRPTAASTDGSGSGATITRVTGGAGGLAATYGAVLALADAFDTAGDQLRDWARLGGRTLTDGDLLESSVLAPLSFAEAETAVTLATAGPDGVLVESLGWEADALAVRAVVKALTATDELVRAQLHTLDTLAGRTVGLGLGSMAPLWIGPAAGGWAAFHLLPDDVRSELSAEGSAAAEAWLVDHPELLEHLVDGSGGLLDGLARGVLPGPGLPGMGGVAFTPDAAGAAADLAALYGSDGSPVVRPYPGSVAASGVQPTGLADLVGHLQQVAELSDVPDSPANGTIEVQTFTGPDGGVRHVVYLPGTDDLGTLPWTQDGDVRDMGTNLLLVAGADNAYQDGILRAMHDAGIGPDEPVLLVGHSQGGMEAAAILGHGSPYDVTDVVTAGAPTAQVDGFPPGSHVTSLEHRGDVVPLLDGQPNPDTVPQVTIGFSDGPVGGIVDNHGYDHYVAGAAAADASHDPGVLANLASLHDHGFLDGGESADTIRSQLFQISRAP